VTKANRRGVHVRAILDENQEPGRYATYPLNHAGVPVEIDDKPAIAHNKEMVFDDQALFTGSFNFNKSARECNAENRMLVCADTLAVKADTDNWHKRYRQSRAY